MKHYMMIVVCLHFSEERLPFRVKVIVLRAHVIQFSSSIE